MRNQLNLCCEDIRAQLRNLINVSLPLLSASSFFFPLSSSLFTDAADPSHSSFSSSSVSSPASQRRLSYRCTHRQMCQPCRRPLDRTNKIFPLSPRTLFPFVLRLGPGKSSLILSGEPSGGTENLLRVWMFPSKFRNQIQGVDLWGESGDSPVLTSS